MATRKKPNAATQTAQAQSPAVVMSAQHEQAVIMAALAIVEARLKAVTLTVSSPEPVKNFLKLQLGALEREVFGVMFLNAKNRMIAFEIMFQGTLTQTSVYPREVARRALEHNAASVILAHNHPSGVIMPSTSDKLLTDTLERSLALIDVAVLDHVIVGGVKAYSFAEQGLLDRTKAPEADAACTR